MKHRTSVPEAPQIAPDLNVTVDSLQRGLEVLRNFRVGDNSLSVGDLSARTGLPRPTVARLINTLTAHRFVCPIPGTDRYRADVACQSVGHALLSNHPLVVAGAAGLRSLASRFEVDLTIAVRDRLDMLCIADCHGTRSEASPERGQESKRKLQTITGALLPIASTAIGCAWLWSQPAQVQGEIFQHVRANAFGPGASVLMPKIYRAFHDLEKDGFCTYSEEGAVPAVSIGVPIIVASQSAGALGCFAEVRGVDRQLEISETLGREMAALALQIGRVTESS